MVHLGAAHHGDSGDPVLHRCEAEADRAMSSRAKAAVAVAIPAAEAADQGYTPPDVTSLCLGFPQRHTVRPATASHRRPGNLAANRGFALASSLHSEIME
jgi:hypothetical protein